LDILALLLAFIFGLAARAVGLPPLVGFLLTGFVLKVFGVDGGPVLEEAASLGVTLLLFTIGLKLKLRGLARPEVWVGASVHAVITTGILGAVVWLLAVAGLSLFADIDLGTAFVLAFALSFSSTVFAVKVMEEKGEMSSLHGRTAIGILIMEDIFAVIFLVFAAGKVPSPWAVGLVLLYPLRRLLTGLLERSGHGELLMLLGVLLALGGSELFEIVKVKGDLGALIVGMLLANHPKAEELGKTLLGFKDLFLVGFFVNIGLSGTPSIEALGLAVLLVAFVPFKTALFFAILARFGLRARTAWMGATALATYSEFGLIVLGVAASNGWMADDWLVTIAIAVSLTFVIASPLNANAHLLYARYHEFLRRFQIRQRHSEDLPIDTGTARIAVLGMGRLGTAVYDRLVQQYGPIVIGLDTDPVTAELHQTAGRNVLHGDATDSDFWDRVDTHEIQINVVLLTMANYEANLRASQVMAGHVDLRFVATIVRHPDEVEKLSEQGVHAVYDLFGEAGRGFARDVRSHLDREALLQPVSEEPL
jgi:predicted Kef-type K+ transport protein